MTPRGGYQRYFQQWKNHYSTNNMHSVRRYEREVGANWFNYSDVITSATASQITGVSIVYSTVCPGADQRKHQSTASLALVRRIQRWPVSQRVSNAENVSIWWHHHAPYNLYVIYHPCIEFSAYSTSHCYCWLVHDIKQEAKFHFVRIMW